jgi:beta-lactamase regulating signal transducer with metallopeptidase domain
MTALIDLTIKSTALLAAGTLIGLIIWRASASSRHLVWAGVLCAIALLPISRLSLPALNVAVLASDAPQPFPRSLSVPLPLEPRVATASPGIVEHPPTPRAIDPSPARITFSYTDVIVATWWLGMAALLVRAVAGHIALRRLTSRATAGSDARALAILQEAVDGFRVRRRIALLSHDHDGLPCTFGVIRPVILLPTSLLGAGCESVSRLRAVVIHETAHIARFDAISEHITQVAVMVFWFHPLVWLAARQARFERERAADDAVLACGAKASDYASDLVAIARTQSKALWSSAVPMAVSALERRVRAILDGRVRRGPYSRLSVAMTMVVLAAMLPVSAVRLVARQAPLPPAIQLDIPATVAPANPAVERRVSARAAVLPRLSSASPPQVAQAPPAAQTTGPGDPLADWNAERLAKLKQVLERARKCWADSLTKVEIGTAAAIDTKTFETLVAQLEQMVLSFTVAPSTTLPSSREIDSVRAAFAAAMKNLDVTQIRFDNGLLTNQEMANALMAAARTLGQHSNLETGQEMFTTANFPGSSEKDRNSAKALYELLTGRVSSINGPDVTLSDTGLLAALKNATNIASDVDRADGLVMLAQKYALTPEMVSAYVAAANSIKTKSERDRVFAQSIRVKSPGLSPGYYWQR